MPPCGGIEMNIGHQRHIASAAAHHAAYLPEVAGMSGGLSRKAYNVAACAGYAYDLFGRSICIHGGGVGHRLHSHRIISSDVYAAYVYFR